MRATYRPFLHRFAVVLAACTFLLLIAGALVTSNEAALSVPDWPLSYGSLTPPMVGGIRYEHSHRVIAATIGFLTIVLAVLLHRQEKRAWVRRLGVAAVVAVCLQGLLGGLTVLYFQHYGFPMEHASLAQLFFGAIVGIALFTSRWWMEGPESRLEDCGAPGIHTIALINCGVIFAQVILGAGYRHNTIPVWPHLLGALAVTGTVTWTGIALRKGYDAVGPMTRARIILHSIFGAQFLLGFAALGARMATARAPQPVPWAVIVTVVHTVTGALTFASALLIAFLCYRLVKPRSAATAAPRSSVEATAP